MAETDGIEEALEGTVGVAVTAAARAGELLARQREERLRQAQAHSEQAARELRGRYEAEQAAAAASLAAVRQPGWSQGAGSDDIARAVQTATRWPDADPKIVIAARRTARDLSDDQEPSTDPHRAEFQSALRWSAEHDREAFAAYFVGASACPDAVELVCVHEDKLIARWEAARQQAGPAAGKSLAENSEAVALVANADRLDARAAADAAREGSDVLYDSRERRQELAGQFIGVVDAETVDVRVRADTSQAKPANGSRQLCRRSDAPGTQIPEYNQQAASARAHPLTLLPPGTPAGVDGSADAVPDLVHVDEAARIIDSGVEPAAGLERLDRQRLEQRLLRGEGLADGMRSGADSPVVVGVGVVAGDHLVEFGERVNFGHRDQTVAAEPADVTLHTNFLVWRRSGRAGSRRHQDQSATGTSAPALGFDALAGELGGADPVDGLAGVGHAEGEQVAGHELPAGAGSAG